MSQPFDAAQDLKDAPRTGAAQRPRDAATLILTREAKAGTEVLMGRRAPGHVFMGFAQDIDAQNAGFGDMGVGRC